MALYDTIIQVNLKYKSNWPLVKTIIDLKFSYLPAVFCWQEVFYRWAEWRESSFDELKMVPYS